MKTRKHSIVEFPRSRIATFDIGALSRNRHYVTALLELDVTAAREKIRNARKNGAARISFTAWLLKVIAMTVGQYREVAAFRCGRRRLMIFDDVDISILVEKELDGARVPIPLLLRRTNEKTVRDITAEIEKARAEKLAAGQIVLEKKTDLAEKLYYFLPAALRRLAWRIMLRRPSFLFSKMGNVVFTAVGMMGKVNGWFVQTSIHPLSFGVGAITKKPVAAGDGVRVGEVLHLTVLVDHNAVDGAPMARFINALTANIESGSGL